MTFPIRNIGNINHPIHGLWYIYYNTETFQYAASREMVAPVNDWHYSLIALFLKKGL
jgi:hypothetical protein